MPIGRRSETQISIVDGSTRRSAASATHGDSSSAPPIARQVRGQDARAAEPVGERLHFAAGQPHVAVHDDLADLERRAFSDQRRSLDSRRRRPTRSVTSTRMALQLMRARGARRASRLDLRAAEVLLGRRLDLHERLPSAADAI